MDLIFRHFALVMIAGMLVNAAIASRRIPELVRQGGGNEAEARRFLWGTTAWLAGLFAVLELATVATGASSPACVIPTAHPSDTVGYLVVMVWLAWTVGATLWVFVAGGAEVVARYGPVFARRYRPGLQYNPKLVRALTLAWCIGTIAIPFVLPGDSITRPECNRARVLALAASLRT